ncbi:hypothetical protein [Streptomyces globosus]|uniref:hypothetical protein n=1 Tax=Streptomyces globosus TaxID=68209 RepID=UPI0031D44D02
MSATTIAAVALLLSLVACGTAGEAAPEKICGTPISPGLSSPLLRPHGKIVEGNLLEQPRPGVIPCEVLVDGKRALTFRFGFHDGPRGDLLDYARKSTVVGLTEPTQVNLGFEDSVLGNNGAAATAACKTKGGDHFTLMMKVDRANVLKQDLRPHIEAFMRAYMAAALKTFGCG